MRNFGLSNPRTVGGIDQPAGSLAQNATRADNIISFPSPTPSRLDGQTTRGDANLPRGFSSADQDKIVLGFCVSCFAALLIVGGIFVSVAIVLFK